ncbi:MAG: hypothetical protein L3K15_01850 [Thermoplasmata archaeon]|nr:hypothetical protein [Thermoplasmata archaeon]
MANELRASPALAKTRSRVRWLSVLTGLAVVLVAGVVVADVVLNFTTSTGVGANTSAPFEFQNGANYATAHGFGFVTSAYPGGSSPGVSVTTTISGIATVPVSMFDVNELITAVLTTSTAHVGNVFVPSAAAVAVAGLICAYAFVSTALPSAGAVAVAGAPAGCAATLPTLGALSSGCSGGVANVAAVNLVAGTVTGSIAASCTVPSATAASTIVLYVSYYIATSGPVAATTLNSFAIPITLP